jgi:hypothetical protein
MIQGLDLVDVIRSVNVVRVGDSGLFELAEALSSAKDGLTNHEPTLLMIPHRDAIGSKLFVCQERPFDVRHMDEPDASTGYIANCIAKISQSDNWALFVEDVHTILVDANCRTGFYSEYVVQNYDGGVYFPMVNEEMRLELDQIGKTADEAAAHFVGATVTSLLLHMQLGFPDDKPVEDKVIRMASFYADVSPI